MNNSTIGCILLLIISQSTVPITVQGWEINLTIQVSSVVDGDTFRIPNDRIRLADIDAPEINEEGYQKKATDLLTNLINCKTVYLYTYSEGRKRPKRKINRGRIH